MLFEIELAGFTFFVEDDIAELNLSVEVMFVKLCVDWTWLGVDDLGIILGLELSEWGIPLVDYYPEGWINPNCC